MLSLHRHAARAASARSALFSTAAAATPSVSSESAAAAASVLQVDVRQVEGSRAARRLRKQGLLPGVLYGEGEDGDASKVLVALPTRAFEKLHRKLWSAVENQVFDVQVGDSAPVKACMRDVQFDPVTDKPLAVNFMRYKPGRKVSIPVSYLNEEGSPGLKRGGFINYIHHELECTIYTDQVPETLQIDVNGLHVGDRIYLEAINFPEGVVPTMKPGSMVSKIAGRRGLIPRAEPVVEAVQEAVEVEQDADDEFDDWNDIF